jgi:hypothetical protein
LTGRAEISTLFMVLTIVQYDSSHWGLAPLMAALLAVLGKQWLLHYNSVGERGTIAEWGAEQQHKFDGMRWWRFDLVMQVFPLLLQLSLLLFSTALSIYLWTIHYVIAAIALTLTRLGSLLYAGMVISTVLSPDSLPEISHLCPESSSQTISCSWNFAPATYLALPLQQTHTGISWCWTTWSGTITQIASLLPLFHDAEPLKPIPIFDPPGPPSVESTAVTSSDPGLVERTTKLVSKLQ